MRPLTRLALALVGLAADLVACHVAGGIVGLAVALVFGWGAGVAVAPVAAFCLFAFTKTPR